ncbi:MAG TPA: transcription antitermination factor NusB [Vicinamibacteria bacterium]|nr:transcription antitermination factor NusB [Vicinamibacteria bacterium]
MAGKAREVARRVLGRVAGRHSLADALAAPAVERLDERERAFLHELVLGTLRRRGWLDHVLAGLSSRPLRSLTPGVLDALRLGAYQLLFTRVAPPAAVSESVELARRVEARSAGFANAVLRRLQREGPPPEPDAVADPAGWLTTAGSLPAWLAERWIARLGPPAAVARARALLVSPPTHVRLNPRVPDAEAQLAAAGVETRPAAVAGALEARGPVVALAERGVLYVQDAASQLVARLAAAEGLVLDACAAPGGKSLLVADLAGSRARVLAAELSPRRLATLVRLRSRWGATNVLPLAADALRPPFAPATFDAVLLDAPCSGLGTLARNPDIRWRLAPQDLARHAERQRALLEAVAALVRPGGRLVYAVCSVEPEETGDVLQPFLEAHSELEREGLPAWAEAFADAGVVRTDPARDRTDAFFAAALRRAG